MQMSRGFWMGLLVFQLAYGAVVFGITREYYKADDLADAGTAAPHALPSAASGSGNCFRSTLPLGVRGSADSDTITAGTM